MVTKSQFDEVRSQSTEQQQWEFDRSQAAIDAHNKALGPDFDEENATLEQKSVVQARATEQAIQNYLFGTVVTPVTGEAITEQAYHSFEAANPPPKPPVDPVDPDEPAGP